MDAPLRGYRDTSLHRKNTDSWGVKSNVKGWSGGIWVTVILFAFPCPDSYPAPPPAAQDPSIEQLISQLDHESPVLRDAASEALKKRGKPVLPILQERAARGTPETQARIAELITRIKRTCAGSVGIEGGDEGRRSIYAGPRLSKSPEVLWSFRADNPIYASLVIADDDLYFGDAPKGALSIGGKYSFYCLDRNSGRLKWKVQRGEAPHFSPPVVSEDLVCVGNSAGAAAYWRKTGELHWIFDGKDFGQSSPVLSEGLVLFCGSSHVYAIELDTGRERWNFNIGKDQPLSPAIHGRRVIVGSRDRYIHAIDLETGKAIWTFEADNWITSSPSLSEGSVYVACKDFLYAVDERTGVERWRFKIDGSSVLATPTIAAGMLYATRYDNALIAVDAATGNERWQFKTGTLLRTSPSYVDGKLYLGSLGGVIYVLDALTGKEEAHFESKGRLSTSPVLTNGVLYYSDNTGPTVFALK